jgi:hypothetical protein
MDAAALYRRTKAGGTFWAAAERPPLMKQMRNLPTTASTAAQQFRLDVPRTWLLVRPPAAAVRLRRAKRRRTRQVCAAPWAAVGMWPFLCVCVCVRVCACVTSRSSHYQQLANPGVRPEYPRSARRVLVEYPRIVPSTIVALATLRMPPWLFRAAATQSSRGRPAQSNSQRPPPIEEKLMRLKGEYEVRTAPGRAGAAHSIALQPHSRATSIRRRSRCEAARRRQGRCQCQGRARCGLQAKLRAERLRRDEAELKARARVARGIPQGPPMACTVLLVPESTPGVPVRPRTLRTDP